MKKIDFVISVKNRESERVQKCVNSLQSEYTGEIIVVDYGSTFPLEVKNCTLIKYNKNPIWNKSHALNLGIKKGKNDYICTVDCDIILSEKIINLLYKNLEEDTFIYNTNVRRIEIKDLGNDFDEMIKKSKPWNKSIRSNIYSFANGGIQCFSRKWIESIGGYDEHLGVYFGAMDNRLYEQAYLSKSQLINLNFPMFHQEHSKKKEENLLESEREKASMIRSLKTKWLEKALEKGILNNEGSWGEDKPNQSKFLDLFQKQVEFQIKNEKINHRALISELFRISQFGKGEFNIGGMIFEIKPKVK